MDEQIKRAPSGTPKTIGADIQQTASDNAKIVKDSDNQAIAERIYTVAIGKSCQDTRWINKQVTWAQLVDKCRSSKATKETYAEYCTMDKTAKGKAKDLGGFVGGALKADGPRSKSTIASRSLVTLDIDFGKEGVLTTIRDLFSGVSHFVYSTHSHTPEKPRYRLVVPLHRDVTPDEYQAIGRKMAEKIGIDQFDKSTYEPERLMFWPSHPRDVEPVFEEGEGAPANADSWLAEYDDWTDVRSWPRGSSETGELRAFAGDRKAQDPTTKSGVIGAFCRAHDINDVCDNICPGIYDSIGQDDRRIYYASESRVPGALIKDGGKYIYSEHGTDPLQGKLLNSFDLCRLLKFGQLDEGMDPDTPGAELPSYKGMMRFAEQDSDTIAEMNRSNTEAFEQLYRAQAARAESIGEKTVTGLVNGLLDEITKRRINATKDDNGKLRRKDRMVTAVIAHVGNVAFDTGCGLWQSNGAHYIYDGEKWLTLPDNALKQFLGQAAVAMGVESLTATNVRFTDYLFDQFCGIFDTPESPGKGKATLVNLKNGTLEVSGKGAWRTRKHRPDDRLKYCLPFSYDKHADCPIWRKFLNEVLPQKELQDVLGEFFGWVFVKTRNMKLEKMLMLYGNGANGKSVVFEVITAMLGPENVSYGSLEDITSEGSWTRADLDRKLLNFSSEISRKIHPPLLKQLTSGEPVKAQRKHKDPFEMTDYAKLVCNCNALPEVNEFTKGFFRRFLIIPFNVTIPDDKQDIHLAEKIIANELPGVFNWVLEGLDRLRQNGRFTSSPIINEALRQYEEESDSVQMFVEECEITKDVKEKERAARLWDSYAVFCQLNGYHWLGMKKFNRRLREKGFNVVKEASGQVVYCKAKIDSVYAGRLGL